jgi:hypothetical protein
MALVIVIALAWLVILIPGFLRRRSASDESVSISHFHRQLRVLEHSAPPPIVAPAYRLRVDEDGADGPVSVQPAEPPALTVVGARDLPRPALAFLGEDPGRRDHPGWEVGSRTVPSGPEAADRLRPDAGARRLARQRRRDTLAVLILGFVASLMIGFVPGARVAWAAAGVFGVALAAYLGLLVQLRRRAEERERKLHYLPAAPHAATAPVEIEDTAAYPHPGALAIR